ncbi:MAG TPA: ribosomal protein L7/L12, partial [Blastocatellia bacterium]|nr:ribosomal protein L7/L12 [Blastocatellia bacterium]
MKLLNCTTCAAPLDVESVRAMTVRCTYCGNTIIIPYALRESGDGEGFAGPFVDQALRLAEVARLAKAGKKIDAIKLYRTIFQVGLKEAKDAVEQIEAGRPITYTHSVSHVEHLPPQNPGSIRITQGPNSGNMPRQTVLWLVLGAVVLCVAGAAVAAIAGFASFFSSPAAGSRESPGRATATVPRPVVPPITLPGATSSSPSTPAFAELALEFGSEGIGAGQFKDARSVAVDGEGRIYVGEYTGGRIQVFDSNGTFLTQWMADTKPVLLSLAADRKGTVYVVHPGSIFRYEGATGKPLGEVPKLLANGRYEYFRDVFVALDGSLFAIGGDYTIIRISPEGGARIVVNVKEKTGENLSIERVAVDG